MAKKKTKEEKEVVITEEAQPKEEKKGTKKKEKEKVAKHFGVQDLSNEDLEKYFKLTTTAVDKKFENVFHAFLYEEDKLVTRRFSTGSVGFDMSLGGDGLPYGRILEVWGPEGGGKTSLALEIAWNLQRATGKAVVFIDIEHKFDKMLLKNWKGVGFIPNMTRYEEPFTGEDAFGLLEQYVQSPATGIVIMDSVSGLRSATVLDSDDQETHYGKQAKLISDHLPKISGLAAHTGVPMLFVNQVRANLEASKFAKGRFKLTKTGGKAFGHYVCISAFVDKIGGEKGILSDGVRDFGHWCNVWIYKNHSGPTLYKNFQMCLHYGYGYDPIAELVDMSSRLGIIETNGSWLSAMNDTYKVQGRDNLIQVARYTPELEQYLWTEIKKMQTATVRKEDFQALDPEQTQFVDNDEGIEITIPE